MKRSYTSYLSTIRRYPTFDILAYQFDLARSKACENIHKLTPILAKTFEEIGVKPKRKIDSPDEFKEVFGAASAADYRCLRSYSF